MTDFHDELKNNCREFATKYNYKDSDLGRGFEALVAHISAQAPGFSTVLEGEDLRKADLSEWIIRWGDFGVDAYLEDEFNRRILLIQAKWISGKGNPSEADVNSFFDIPRKLSDDDIADKLLATAGPEAQRLLASFREKVGDGWSVIARFATNRPADGERLAAAREAANSLYEREGRPVACELIGQADLKTIWDDAIHSRTGVLESVSFKLPKEHFFEREAPYQTIVGVISGNELKSLYKQHQNRLFALNIRLPLSLSKDVNPEIEKTARNEPEKFFYYNNGVSGICGKYSRDGNQVTATDFQIINGAQTVGTLARVEKLAPECTVMFRLTAVEGLDPQFRDEVTRTNNTQNVVYDWDFRANDPIQRYLDHAFDSYSGKGPLPNFYYQPKRGDTKSGAGGRALSSENLARVRYSYLYSPIETYKTPKLLARTDPETGLYSEAFGVNGKLESMWSRAHLDEAMFAMALEYYLTNKAAEYKKSGHQYSVWLKRLSRYVVGLYGYAVRETEEARKDYATLLSLSAEQFDDAVSPVVDKALSLVSMEYLNRKRDSDQVQPEYNLSRDSDTWEMLSQQLVNQLTA